MHLLSCINHCLPRLQLGQKLDSLSPRLAGRILRNSAWIGLSACYSRWDDHSDQGPRCNLPRDSVRYLTVEVTEPAWQRPLELSGQVAFLFCKRAPATTIIMQNLGYSRMPTKGRMLCLSCNLWAEGPLHQCRREWQRLLMLKPQQRRRGQLQRRNTLFVTRVIRSDSSEGDSRKTAGF